MQKITVQPRRRNAKRDDRDLRPHAGIHQERIVLNQFLAPDLVEPGIERGDQTLLEHPIGQPHLLHRGHWVLGPGVVHVPEKGRVLVRTQHHYTGVHHLRLVFGKTALSIALRGGRAAITLEVAAAVTMSPVPAVLQSLRIRHRGPEGHDPNAICAPVVGNNAGGVVEVHENIGINPDHMVVGLQNLVLQDQAFLPMGGAFTTAWALVDIVVDDDQIVAVLCCVGLDALAIETVPHVLVVLADHHGGERGAPRHCRPFRRVRDPVPPSFQVW